MKSSKRSLSLMCVVSGVVLACGGDPAFNQVARSEGAGVLTADSVQRPGEADANAAGVVNAGVIGSREDTSDSGSERSGTPDETSGLVNVSVSNPAQINAVVLNDILRAGGSETPSGADGADTATSGLGVEDVYHPHRPMVPEGKTLLQLQVKQLQSDAWYKNCLSISLNGQTQNVGCNKDPKSVGRWVYLIADKAPACNNVSVKIDTYFNQGTECNERVARGLTCEGPYNDKPDQSRSPFVAADREFYKVHDHSNLNRRDPLIKPNFDWALLGNEMTAYAALKNTSWLRVFFEDLSKSSLETARKNPSAADSNGVNFNDYIFDIKGDDVKVGIEGTDVSCK